MRDLFQHVGYVRKEDDRKTSIDKIRKGLQSRTNVVVNGISCLLTSHKEQNLLVLVKRDLQCSQIDLFRRLRLETGHSRFDDTTNLESQTP